MANSLVVRKETSLARRTRALRAAQYVRMSTDYQRYSIENQVAVIATYAQVHGLTIVRTYQDAGESGLKLKNRAGLIQLLEDVQSGRGDFNHILVYDVSRWGRFQDTDESAHYEFICKEAGIQVKYCAEEFDNDGSLLATIVKALKRAMAAEYSRELSRRVFAGQCNVIRKGFWRGGPAPYGLRRELVDEHGRSRGFLSRGERKYLQTDRVILRPGTGAELDIVRQIFHQFVVEGESAIKIARDLNDSGVTTTHGFPWRERVVRKLLKNESYIGINLYNRASERLGQKRRPNPPDLWVRGTLRDFKPVVDLDIFFRAKERFVERHPLTISDEEMLERLRLLLKKAGRLSATIIDEAEHVPSNSAYINRFGSLRRAYELIGYRPKNNLRYSLARKSSAAVLRKLVDDVTEKFRTVGATVEFRSSKNILVIDGRLILQFHIARCFLCKKRWPRWTFYSRPLIGVDRIMVARMDEANKNILDYYLLPLKKLKLASQRKVDLTKTNCEHLETYHAANVDALVRLIFKALTSVLSRR